MTEPARVCKDCVDVGGPQPRRPRPAPYPGPRCATHHRLHRQRQREAAHGRRTETVYSLAPEDYRRLYEHQGRRCAICRRATGATKRLAVDHDHSCCPGPTSCGRCVRGLVCGPCNSMLAHARDDAELFRRAIRYLREWPALAI
jgi:hypothetical protein